MANSPATEGSSGHARVHGNPHESTGQGKRRFVVTTRPQEFETNDRRR